MKVLISRKDLKDTKSGVPKKVLQELRFFSSRGHDSFAIAETINKPLISEFGGNSVKTMRWPFSGFFRRKFYQFQVDRWIRKNRPDIVIGHGDILHQDVLFIHNCVHLAHELVEKKPLPSNHEVGKIHEAIFKTGSFKLLICNSHLMKNDLVSRFDLDPNKLQVIYPEVNLSKFQIENSLQASLEWRKKFNLKEKDLVIGLITSGNFKKRNLSLLIEAYKILSKDHPEVKLFIAGGNVDDKYVKSSEGFNVVFAPSIVDVKFYYNLIDIFVLPAHIEEFGRSVLEAMISQKAVIASKYVGASEVFENEAKNFILSEMTVEELVVKLEKLITDSELRERLKLENYRTAIKYSAENQNKEFEKKIKDFNIF